MTAQKTGVSAAYAYDPLGRRTKKSGSGYVTTFFLDSGNDEIAEYDQSGALLRRYIPGRGVDQPIAMVTAAGVRSFFHQDKTGSVVAMSDTNGNIALNNGVPDGPYTYDPYGNGAPTTGVPYKYTGRRLDPETGLYYYRARFYSANLGRFLQTDPIGYKDDYDLYAYVGNDPTDKTDPSGKASYMECRDVVVIGTHCYTVVTNDKDGSVRNMFSYGPQYENDKLHPGKLVELQGARGSATAAGDRTAWDTGEGVKLKTNLNQRGLTDDAVINAGKKVDSILGTPTKPGPTNYYFFYSPTKGFGNSNSATARVLEEAKPGSSRKIDVPYRTPGWGAPENVGTAPPPPPSTSMPDYFP